MTPAAASPAASPATEYLLLGLLALLWGSSYLLNKVALASIPPFTLIAIRVSVAGLVIGAVLHLRGERLRATPRPGAR